MRLLIINLDENLQTFVFDDSEGFTRFFFWTQKLMGLFYLVFCGPFSLSQDYSPLASRYYLASASGMKLSPLPAAPPAGSAVTLD